MHSSTRFTLVLAAAFAAFAHSAAAQCRVDKVVAPAPQDFARFGQSVAISGTRAVVGAPFGLNAASVQTGTAYVFELGPNGWDFQAQLLAPDGADFDDFGVSVAIDGDHILVGADSTDGPQSGAVGAVYSFDWSGTQWIAKQKLRASDGASGGFFGCSVALRGDTAVIGRFWDSAAAPHGGSAYVFSHNGSSWSQAQKLVASNATNEDNFGWSVALSDTRVVVGAPERFDNAGSTFTQFGQVYVFEKSGATWSQTKILTEAVPVQWDQLGISVAIDHDRIIAGAWRDNFSPPISGVGSAHVFEWNGASWSESILAASDPQSEAEFGASVAIEGDYAVVGTPSHDAFPLWGAIYVFHHETAGWTQTEMFLPDPSPSLSWLGMSLAIDGNHAICGASIESMGGTQNGTAYLLGGFAPWIDLGFALAGSNGAPELDAVGSLCSGTTTTLSLTHARPNSGAVIIRGSSQVDLPFFGGTLVPKPEKIFRGLATDASGALTFVPPELTLPPGTPTYYQAWIRDPTAPQGFAASNGISGVAP